MYTSPSQPSIYSISNIQVAVIPKNLLSLLFLAKTKAIQQVLQITYIRDRKVKLCIVIHTSYTEYFAIDPRHGNTTWWKIVNSSSNI